MTNKKILSLSILILTLPLVSATFYLEDIIENQTIILAVVFLILFTILRFALAKTVFRENNMVSALIALCISALITFALFQRGTIDELMYVISTSSQVLVTIGVIIISIVIIWAFVKFIRAAFGHAPRSR